MPTPLPVSFRLTPLPDGGSYTPQQLAEAIVARLNLDTQESLALFQIGSVLPTSDEGPILKDGVSWWVWNDEDGEYVPQTVEFYDSLNPKPFRAEAAAAIDVVFAGAGAIQTDLEFTSVFDPDSVFSTNEFTAPDDGFYHIDAKCGVSVTAGSPVDNICIFYLKKNGIQMPKETVFQELVDPAAGRTFSINTTIQLAAGDTIRPTVGFSIASGSGTWTVTANDTWIAGYKIRNLTF
jgi:hypothetical protein